MLTFNTNHQWWTILVWSMIDLLYEKWVFWYGIVCPKEDLVKVFFSLFSNGNESLLNNYAKDFWNYSETIEWIEQPKYLLPLLCNISSQRRTNREFWIKIYFLILSSFRHDEVVLYANCTLKVPSVSEKYHENKMPLLGREWQTTENRCLVKLPNFSVCNRH